MKIFYSKRFEKDYKKLPNKIRDLFEKQENTFRKDPFDSSLKTHKLHGELNGFWAWSINYEYRIIFDFAENGVIRFYRAGKHDIY